jgi:hypothetical protein
VEALADLVKSKPKKNKWMYYMWNNEWCEERGDRCGGSHHWL